MGKYFLYLRKNWNAWKLKSLKVKKKYINSSDWKLLSHVQLFVTPWTIQAMEFSRPECWSGYHFPSPGDRLNPGIEPRSPTLQADSLPAKLPGKPHHHYKVPQSTNLNSQKRFHGMSQRISHSHSFFFPSTSWDVWNTREKQNKKQLFSRDYITKIS